MSETKPTEPTKPATQEKKGGFVVKFLDFIEWAGNKLPDPAVLFLIGLFVTWGLSASLSGMTFTETKPNASEPVKIVNMLTLDKFAEFMTKMVKEFYEFPPLGIVLVALLGVAVAEHSGLVNACLKSLLNVTPQFLLTPMLILVAIVSHTAADAGYVLVIPIGGVMFYAAGRHPLAGIACAFAGVSGGFCANFIISGIDPLLSSLTQTGVEIVDKDYQVNPLCNWFFAAVSSVFIIGVGWFLTDKIIEPRLQGTEIDGNPDEIPKFEELTTRDKLGMWTALASIVVSCVLFTMWAMPKDSELRDEFGSLTTYVNKVSDFGFAVEPNSSNDLIVTAVAKDGPAEQAGVAVGDQLASVEDGQKFNDLFDYKKWTLERNHNKAAKITFAKAASAIGDDGSPATVAGPVELTLMPAKVTRPGAPLMKMIVPLIFLIFVIPGLVHGYISGTYKNHRDVVKGMSKTMETMGYYLVLVFFAAMFIAVFKSSGIGDLLALKGAAAIEKSGASPALTVVGIILMAASVNLLIGSSSAKWTMLAPIFVPMLMYAGISPELTQAAYRIGDSTTNIITPMMPYFPLVVVFCQRYVKSSGIGTVAALMIPYSIAFLVTWTLVLLAYWGLGLPLGLPTDVGYEYVMPEAVKQATEAAAAAKGG